MSLTTQIIFIGRYIEFSCFKGKKNMGKKSESLFFNFNKNGKNYPLPNSISILTNLPPEILVILRDSSRYIWSDGSFKNSNNSRLNVMQPTASKFMYKTSWEMVVFFQY